ncbi:MAG TPA: hypothetical protein VHO06_13580, partial [Polyangia bacterium]|nr:hypothetical protein [Polyangia bacterium]
DGDPHGLVSELLLARGVRSVPIAGWGAPFEALLRGCFAPLPLPPPLSRAPAGARRARPR